MFSNCDAVANVMPKVVIELLVWYQQTFVSRYNINKTQKYSPALLSLSRSGSKENIASGDGTKSIFITFLSTAKMWFMREDHF